MQELIATLKLLRAIGDKKRGKSYAGVEHHVISRFNWTPFRRCDYSRLVFEVWYKRQGWNSISRKRLWGTISCFCEGFAGKSFKPRLRRIPPHASTGAQKWKVKADGENGGWGKARVHAKYTDATCWYTEICWIFSKDMSDILGFIQFHVS